MQLLNDITYHADSFEPQQWLVYFISKPLIGMAETIKIVPASLVKGEDASSDPESPMSPNGAFSGTPKKKEIKSFTDLLNNFPMIARQMQPGLDRLFKTLGKEFDKPLPALPTSTTTPISIRRRRETSISSGESLASSFHSNLTNGIDDQHHHPSLDLSNEEEAVRRSVETAVTAAIDMFQLVDKQQLSLLGSTTDLTGTMVERMIEKYITEQVHDSLVFPKLCTLRKNEDGELDTRIRQMGDIDISQVGLSISQGRAEKHALAVRLSKGVEKFKELGNAGSPQEMIETLLESLRVFTSTQPVSNSPPQISGLGSGPVQVAEPEKPDLLVNVNADTLVSLLLIVLIRSPVRNLRARLLYMRHFIFIDDVENGEMGYALSTFEAVLAYLTNSSNGLRRASRRNRRLWHATKTGNIEQMRAILEPDLYGGDEDASIDEQRNGELSNGLIRQPRTTSFTEIASLGGTTLHEASEPSSLSRASFESLGTLAHVFPFQRPPTPPPEERPRMKKRVSMETRSTSSSSGFSLRSFPETIGSHASGTDGDISIERLSMTQGSDGESIMMMAVESGQVKALEYLLNMKAYYPIGSVLDDENNEGTTLLSAAVQSGRAGVTDLLLDFILDHAGSDGTARDYLARQDSQGRCVAHYLFNYPNLISRIGQLIPWRLKDKNGQSPLFAMCRSYDHEEYKWMVDTSLTEAAQSQPEGPPLHLDDHVDAKGNTLLHIVNEPQMVGKLLYHCDSDVNASNDKQFTPLMVASKFGRTDVVRVLFGDPRVDLHAKDTRGLTATELAKDDDVRNRIDDFVLLTTPPTPEHRVTNVVRSFFVEDGTVRFIVKSGGMNPNSTITVTTCRRALSEFESLASMLAFELPASWLPDVSKFSSPFLIPSKPSRSVARDIQLRLDGFLKILLAHSTFATHEMVWEFFLVPDIDSNMLDERSKRKAEIRAETVRDEYDPVTDIREVEQFVAFAKENFRSLHQSNKSVLRRANRLRLAQTDLFDAAMLSVPHISALTFLPESHTTAYTRYTRTLSQTEFSPYTSFHYSLTSIASTITAILTALNRPSNLISSMQTSQRQLDRHASAYRRSDRWPLGLQLLDDTRKSLQRDAADKMDRAAAEIDTLGRELRYTQQVVAGELAAWQEERVNMGRAALRDLARRMVVAERARLEGMLRAVRGLGLGLDDRVAGDRRNRSWAPKGVDGKAPIVFLPRADPEQAAPSETGR